MLSRHAPSLRLLFETVCAAAGDGKATTLRGGRADATPVVGVSGGVGGTGRPGLRPKNLISLDRYKELSKRVGLLDADLSERDCALCFAWSRMVVVDGATEKGRARDTSLPIEGFLECLCRVATLKALPTDGELAAAGSGADAQADAGTFLLALQHGDNPNLHRDYLRARRRAWGDEPGSGYPQLDRRVEAVISLMIRQVAMVSGFKPSAMGAHGMVVYGDGALSKKEVDKWVHAFKWESE